MTRNSAKFCGTEYFIQNSSFRRKLKIKFLGYPSSFEDHILQEFNTVYLTRLRTYKIARPPKQKPSRGGGLRQINTCRKVPLQVNFLDDTTFCFVVYIVN
jgi:hypothetical protein